MFSRLVYAAALGAALACAAPARSEAHVGIEPKSTGPGPFRAALRVPHSCEGSPTIAVRVTIPEGVIGVKPAPKPGWTVTTSKGAYARTYDYFHGSRLSAGAKEIAWTGGPLADDHFDEFLIVGFVTDAFKPGDAIAFPVVQDCETGRLAWTEIAGSGADPHSLKAPAPVLRVAASSGGEAAVAKSGLDVRSGWARATPGGAKVGAGYLEIVNSGSGADTLLSATTAVAGRTEIHEMTDEAGVMKMRRLEGGLSIRAGASATLAPGGLHLMFLDLRAPLVEGQTFDVELTFERAGKITIPMTVRAIGATAGPSPHADH